jgi:hypothetical protein
MSTWADLKELRDAGYRPAHTLMIFGEGHANLRRAMLELGAMVIDHASDEPVPAQLLQGLDVLLLFERCAESSAIAAAIRASTAPPARCRAWCECSRDLTICPGPCGRRRA